MPILKKVEADNDVEARMDIIENLNRYADDLASADVSDGVEI